MVEIYRDARDFQNILGAYGLGKGYGYDALAGGWGSSTGHGSSYAAATHLAAADPTATRQGTRFDGAYTNSIGEAPMSRISGFPADNYYVWLLVGGGSNAERGAHGVQIGANPEEIVNSLADSRVFAWRQVGANAYAIDAATPIDIQWKNIDGYLHAVRAICLKSDVGAPGQMPAGNTGDLIVGMVAAPPADLGEATASADSTTTAPADTTIASSTSSGQTPADSTTPPPADSTTTTTENTAPADTTASAESTPPADSGQSTPDTSTAPTDSTSTAPVDSSSGSTDAGSPAPADSGSTTTTDTGAAPADSTASAPADSTTSAPANTTTTSADSTTPIPADSTTATGDATPADSTTAPADNGSAPPADTTTQPADTGSTPEVPPPPPPAAPKPPRRPPRPSMSESELVSRMAAAPVGAELTKVGIKALVNTLFEEVTKALVAGEEFTFGGFGRFHVTGSKERVGRDPRSGVQLLVPAKKVVKFKPHTFLRDNVMPPAPKVEIYRNLRDFQGILGVHAPGNGYGYDASIGGWDGSLSHGSEYGAARMLSATGPSINKINVRFGDDYVNSLGNAPVNRAAFQRGNYYVWLLVLGGSGIPAGAHSVKIGDNSEVVVSSGNQPDSPIWQQAGNGLYMIQGGTPIEVGFLAPDGAIHAVVAICLKNSPGAPGQMPAGNGGDMLVTLQ